MPAGAGLSRVLIAGIMHAISGGSFGGGKRITRHRCLLVLNSHQPPVTKLPGILVSETCYTISGWLSVGGFMFMVLTMYNEK